MLKKLCIVVGIGSTFHACRSTAGGGMQENPKIKQASTKAHQTGPIASNTDNSKEAAGSDGTGDSGEDTADGNSMSGSTGSTSSSASTATLKLLKKQLSISTGDNVEFATIELENKKNVSLVDIVTTEGDCNFSSVEVSKNLYSIQAGSRSAQTCRAEAHVRIPLLAWEKIIPLVISFTSSPVGGASGSAGTLSFSFPNPAGDGGKVSGYVESRKAYILQVEGQLEGNFRYGSNVNISLINSNDKTLVGGCQTLATSGSAADAHNFSFLGFASGSTFLGFSAIQTPSAGLQKLAIEAAQAAGAGSIDSVDFIAGDDYFIFEYDGLSLSALTLSHKMRPSRESITDPLNKFLRSSGSPVDALAIASLCDLTLGTGIRGVDKDGNKGPLIKLKYEE